MTTSNRFTYLVITLFISFITACQSTPNQALGAPPNISQNQPFTLLPVETEAEIFELNDDIKQQLTTAFPAKKRNLRSTRKLLQFLLDNGDASLSYQSGATLIANQAYQNLNANCLSLSILAYSMADFLGMHSQFQQVHIPEYWALNKGYNLLTGHINLRVSSPRNSGSNITYVYTAENSLVVDFDPNSRSETFKTTPISKARITAMFYNNKGVAAMLKQQHNSAYSYFLAATKVDPLYSGVWGNLAVFLRINNQLKTAELAYNHALAIDEDNNTALGNLALLYQLTGRDTQAKEILTQLHNKRQSNPYYHISLGNFAYQANAYRDAIKHFNKARRLDSSLHNSYFGLARTYYRLGDFKQVNKHLRLANKYAYFTHDKKRYSSKLSALSTMTAKND